MGDVHGDESAEDDAPQKTISKNTGKITDDKPADEHASEKDSVTEKAEGAKAEIAAKSKNRKYRHLQGPPWKKIGLIAGLALFVGINAGLAFGGMYLYNHPRKLADTSAVKNDAADAPKPAIDEAAVKKAAETASGEAKVTSKHYVSPKANYEFDYPSDWRIEAEADDSVIRLTSAEFQYVDPKNTQVTGKIEMAINKTRGSITGFQVVDSSDKIFEDSQKLAYDNPSEKQRKETNLSFSGMSYEASPIAVFVSGNQAYKKGELVRSKDISKVEPFITVYVDTCSKFCQAYSPGNFNLDIWNKTPLMQEAQKIIKSLRIKG